METVVQSVELFGASRFGRRPRLFDRPVDLFSASGRPSHDAVPGVGDVLRIPGPDFQVIVFTLASVAVQVVSSVGIFPVRPLDCLPGVAVRDVEGVLLVGGLQGNSHVPDLSGAVAHHEDHIPRSDLIQVLQSAGGVSLVAEDERADHAGVAAAAIGRTHSVGVHDLLGLRARNLVFMGAGSAPGALDGPGGPVLLDLLEQLQHVFLGYRFPIGQAGFRERVCGQGCGGVEHQQDCRQCNCQFSFHSDTSFYRRVLQTRQYQQREDKSSIIGFQAIEKASAKHSSLPISHMDRDEPLYSSWSSAL